MPRVSGDDPLQSSRLVEGKVLVPGLPGPADPGERVALAAVVDQLRVTSHLGAATAGFS